MSFSNANTGGKASDPYKEQNMDEPSIQDKVEDLSAFASACKYSMMTTRGGSSGDLVSRCMALAATVRISGFRCCLPAKPNLGSRRCRPYFSYKHRIRQN